MTEDEIVVPQEERVLLLREEARTLEIVAEWRVIEVQSWAC